MDGRWIARAVGGALAVCAVAARVAGAEPPFAPDASNDPRLEQAQRLLRDGRARTALEMFEALDRSRPGDLAVRLGLAEAALASGERDVARRTIDDSSATDPRNPDWIRLRGMLLAAEERRGEALAAWRGLLETLPDREQAYRAAAGLATTAKMLSEAIALLEEGRRSVGDSLAFGEDLAALHDLTGNPEAAAVEYGRAVAAARMSAETAVLRCASLGLDAARARAAADAVAALAAPPARGAERLGFLAWLRLTSGDCAGALAAASEADRAAGGCGDKRLLLGERAGDGACAPAGLAALREAAAACPRDPIGWRASRLLAARLADAGSFAEARDLVRALVDAAPSGSPEGDECLFALAGLLLDGTREPLRAREAYERLSARDPRGGRAWPARLGAARAALYAGDLAAAEKAFRECAERGPDDETREAGLFGLAEVRFFGPEPSKAADDLRSLVARYPRGRYVNDAAERIVFIAQNQDAGDELLREYAGAVRAGLAGDAAAAVPRLDAIVADFPLAGLRDDAALEAALVSAWAGDAAGALARLDAFVAGFAGSPLVPRALLETARIRWRRQGDAAGARDACEALLLRHAESLFADEARALLERIAAAPPAGTSG